jgi:hypothetical protein
MNPEGELRIESFPAIHCVTSSIVSLPRVWAKKQKL